MYGKIVAEIVSLTANRMTVVSRLQRPSRLTFASLDYFTHYVKIQADDNTLASDVVGRASHVDARQTQFLKRSMPKPRGECKVELRGLVVKLDVESLSVFGTHRTRYVTTSHSTYYMQTYN